MLLRFLAASSLSLACLYATAHDHGEHDADAHQATGVSVTQAWSRAMPPSAPTGAAYFVLNNHGDQDDRLLSARTPLADKAELHTHVHEGEVMRMEQIDSVDVPAQGQVEFTPGGKHVMLFGLKKALVAGERFPLTLHFEKSGDVTTEVNITDDAPQGHAHH